MPRIKFTRIILFVTSCATIFWCAFNLSLIRAPNLTVKNGFRLLTSDPLSFKIWRNNSWIPAEQSSRVSISDEISATKALTRLMSREKLWFMQSDGLRPESKPGNIFSNLPIWPDEDPESDRIVNQLMYIPVGYDAGQAVRNKKIYLFYDRSGWDGHDLPLGQQKFLRDSCPVNTCELTVDAADMESADAIFFKVSWTSLSLKKSSWKKCVCGT